MGRKQSAVERLLVWSQVFFFCSGATGLIYQVLWTRRLTLTFGHTVLAVSTVLTAFMAGLAIGSVLAGAWTDRDFKAVEPARFLRVYGYLEGGIGLWALLSLKLLSFSEVFYVGLSARGLTGLPLHLGCFLGAALVLVPPTVAMGATVPILAKLLVIRCPDVGPVLARLYGINTLGALAGAALGGFYLLPRFGLNASMLMAAVVNLAVATGAIVLARRSSGELAQDSGKKEKKRKKTTLVDPQDGRDSPRAWIVPITFGLAGAASMAYQVGWNRSICLSIGSSVYAFSAILVAFLGGLASGSLLYQRLMRDRTPSLNHLGLLYFAIACAGGVTVQAVAWLPQAYLALVPWVGASFGRALLSNVGLAGLVLLLPTFLMGFGFPLATAIYTRSVAELGRSVGQVYGANTLGCIVGAFVAGFFLVPHVGAQWVLKLATAAYFFSALVVMMVAYRKHRRWLAVCACILGTLAVAVLPSWDRGLMTSGVAVYSDLYLGEDAQNFSVPIFYKDGLSSTVSMHLTGEYWELPNMRVNGKVDASLGEGDRLTQYMLGYLPSLLHPAPKHVAVIGLGGGFTLEAVAEVPGIQEIDCAELEPAVLEAAEYWKPFNGRVLEDPRVKVHLTDGRTFILASPQTFDVIISEPSNPWIAGIGNLFTQDFYQHAKEKLRPGGLMCQWFNLYAVSPDDMTMVIRTFYDVFPQGALWQSSGGDLILIGSSTPVVLDPDRVRQVWEGSAAVQRHFYVANLYKPDYFPGHFLMTREQAMKLAGEGPFNTDNQPNLEFSAPLSLHRGRSGENLEVLWAGLVPALPPGVESTAERQQGILHALFNREDFSGLRQRLKSSGLKTLDEVVLAARLEWHDNPDHTGEIRTLFETALKRFPQSSLAASSLADFELDQERFEVAAGLYLRALETPLPGSHHQILLRTGIALLRMGDAKRSLNPLVGAADALTWDALPLTLAGTALVGLHKDSEAIDFLTVALQRNPNDPWALEYMAYALFNQQRAAEAKPYLDRLLALIPNYDAGWLKLALCLKTMGETKASRAAFRKALQLNPQYKDLAKDFEN